MAKPPLPTYNVKYSFRNIECNQHLQRDLQKSADDTGHKELLELKELISKTIKKCKEQITLGRSCFEEEYLKGIHKKEDDILARAEKKNSKTQN